MDDIDIEAIRHLLNRDQMPHPLQMTRMLLDAYEAEHARADWATAGWNRANNECARYFDRMAAAEAKLQAISERLRQRDGIPGDTLAADVSALINPSGAVPEGTPTDE